MSTRQPSVNPIGAMGPREGGGLIPSADSLFFDHITRFCDQFLGRFSNPHRVSSQLLIYLSPDKSTEIGRQKILKKIILALGLIGAPAFAGYQDEIGVIPSIAEQLQLAEQIDFQRLLNFAKTDPRAAGEVMRLNFRGQEYVVDRSMEKRIPTPGNPPPRMSISDILGNVSSDVRGSMRISVHEEFNLDGSLKSRDWQIDFGASAQVETGKDDADEKSHK